MKFSTRVYIYLKYIQIYKNMKKELNYLILIFVLTNITTYKKDTDLFLTNLLQPTNMSTITFQMDYTTPLFFPTNIFLYFY